ncbi:hypothetical protein EGW08_000692 [Elysia chlorotica]|uniref:G-protein coupled receptors family 2 profile 2 domain-containing protein n=1 Tax=Elysia chlorotica TaxID=188477 RepID=A0A3S1AGQ2_ELYCH|nr:hypothetical protein EGW08_000692 [Elysia chlorotica]
MSDISIAVTFDYDNAYYKLERVTVSSFFVGNNTIGRDEYEEQLVAFVSQVWIVPRANLTHDGIEIKPVLLGEELRGFEQTSVEDEHEVRDLQEPMWETTQENEMHESNNDEIFLSSNIQELSWLTMPTTSPPPYSTPAVKRSPLKIIFTHSHATQILRTQQWNLKDEFIDVTYSLACPYVPINITNITTSNKLPKISFLFMGESLHVNSKQKISIVNGEMQMCTSLYKKLTGRVLTRTKQSVMGLIQYYTEMFCVILSVVCLFLSALTYCLFPSLRSLPGLNNLSLCVSLAVAQVCLLITARWGVNNLLPRGYCTMHAVLLHFSWLASFAWMSVCCIHMFRVFTAQSTKFTDNRSDKKRYLHYCMYGFGVPTILVIATYAINAGVTSGNSSGYNDDICFLDTRHSIWTLVLSLLAPLVLVILTNSVMFVLTVRQIVQVTNLQEQRRSRDRQGVITYVKLSTLTGLLGAVVVVAVQLNSSVLSLLTSPLMALQGVFIFVSFTCNQRVRHLYVELFGRGKSSEKTTSTGSSTVRSSSNNPTRRTSF